jgi:hypothetical protein
MVGQAAAQDLSLWPFRIEAPVPSERLLRVINRFSDPVDLRKHGAPPPSHTGHPAMRPTHLAG